MGLAPGGEQFDREPEGTEVGDLGVDLSEYGAELAEVAVQVDAEADAVVRDVAGVAVAVVLRVGAAAFPEGGSESAASDVDPEPCVLHTTRPKPRRKCHGRFFP